MCVLIVSTVVMWSLDMTSGAGWAGGHGGMVSIHWTGVVSTPSNDACHWHSSGQSRWSHDRHFQVTNLNITWIVTGGCLHHNYNFISYEGCLPVEISIVGWSSWDDQFLRREPSPQLVFSQQPSSPPFDTALEDHSPTENRLHYRHMPSNV